MLEDEDTEMTRCQRNDMVSALQIPVTGLRKNQKIFLGRVRNGYTLLFLLFDPILLRIDNTLKAMLS